jgi:hypothetical protein
MRAHLIQSGRDFSSTFRAHSEIFSSINMENYCCFIHPCVFKRVSSSTNRDQKGISTSTIRFPVGNILIHKHGKLLLVSSTLGFSGGFFSSTNRDQKGISTSTIRFPVGNILIHKHGKLLIVSSTLGFSGWFPHPTIGFRKEFPHPPLGSQLEIFSFINMGNY